MRTTWPAAGPTPLWKRDVGAGLSGPVVVGQRLIIFHRVDDQEVVECLDAATGKARWKFAYPTAYHDDFGFDEGPRSTPTVDNGRVYTLGAEGVLLCLTLDKGTKVWSRPLNVDYHVRKGFFGVGTSPIVEGKLVLVNVGGPGAGIVALDKDTGREAWKATTDGASYSSPSAATINRVRHVFFFTRDGLVSVDPASGKVHFRKHWRSRMDASVNAATPVVVGDTVFISACYGTGAVLLRVGKDGVDEIWKSQEAMSNHYGTCVCRDGHLYGFDGRQEHGAQLRCIELKTGKVCWTKEDFGCGSLILADGKLLILTENGDLVSVQANPDGYHETARATVLGKPCRAAIALANGRLYGRDSKQLVCWDLKK